MDVSGPYIFMLTIGVDLLKCLVHLKNKTKYTYV